MHLNMQKNRLKVHIMMIIEKKLLSVLFKNHKRFNPMLWGLFNHLLWVSIQSLHRGNSIEGPQNVHMENIKIIP